MEGGWVQPGKYLGVDVLLPLLDGLEGRIAGDVEHHEGPDCFLEWSEQGHKKGGQSALDRNMCQGGGGGESTL